MNIEKDICPSDWDDAENDGYLDDDMGEGGLFPGDEGDYGLEELEEEIQ